MILNNEIIKLSKIIINSFIFLSLVGDPELYDSLSIKLNGHNSIMRYMANLSEHCVLYEDDSISAQIDYYLDIASVLRESSCKKKKLAAEQKVREKIKRSKTNCLVGSTITFADLVVYLTFTDHSISTKGELNQWAKMTCKENNIP